MQKKLDETTTKFNLEEKERKAAELAVDELSGNLKHLTQHCKGV